MRKLIVSHLLLIMFLVGAASGFLVSNIGWWGLYRGAQNLDRLQAAGPATLQHISNVEKAVLRCESLFNDALRKQRLTPADLDALTQVDKDLEREFAAVKDDDANRAHWQQVIALHARIASNRQYAMAMMETDPDGANRFHNLTTLPLYHELLGTLQGFSARALDAGNAAYKEASAFNHDARRFLVAMTVLASVFFCLTGWLTYRESRQRRRQSAQLDQEHALFRNLFDASNDGVILMEGGRVTDVNPAALNMFALPSAQALGAAGVAGLQPPQQPDGTPSAEGLKDRIIDSALAGSQHFEWQFRSTDGREFPAEVAINAAHLADRNVIQMTVRDISRRKQAELSMRLANHSFENSLEGITITDSDVNILTVNSAFTAITGYALEDVVGKNPRLLSSGRQSREFYDEMWRSLDEIGKWQGEIWNIRKSGEIYPQWLNISRVTDERGKVTNYVGVFSDISERKSAEERILHQVYYDQLTDLPNRVLFADRLNQVMTLAKRRNDFHFAVMFLDLDRFKLINDSMGHDVGDQLLQQAAHRLRGSVRESDTVARMGGDEFTIVLSEIASPKDAANVAQKILEAFQPPFKLAGEEVFVSVSIGASIYPEDGTGVDVLLKNADMAMYRAKGAGGSWFELYDEGLGTEANQRLALETALHKALERQEFELHYQPQFDVETGKLTGFEALLRWRHPERGLLTPEAFLRVAEDCGVINLIGAWVLKTACMQAQAWRQEFPGHRLMTVNLSAREFQSPDLVRYVEQALRESGLPHFCLELEIAEGTVMHNLDTSIAIMHQLANLGVQFSIDRFGTGHSSLAYLKKLPVHALKIDRTFTCDLVTDTDDAAIVSAIVAMAGKLGLRVVAQGVENKQQLALLRSYKGIIAQGWLLGRPVAADASAGLIAEGRPKAIAE